MNRDKCGFTYFDLRHLDYDILLIGMEIMQRSRKSPTRPRTVNLTCLISLTSFLETAPVGLYQDEMPGIPYKLTFYYMFSLKLYIKGIICG